MGPRTPSTGMVVAGIAARRSVGAHISLPYLEGLRADCLVASQHLYRPALLQRLGVIQPQMGLKDQALADLEAGLDPAKRLSSLLYLRRLAAIGPSSSEDDA